MALADYPTEDVLRELNTRGVHGVVSVHSPTEGRIEVWWGDRVRCLGMAQRLVYQVNLDLDKSEDAEVQDEEEAEEADEAGLQIEFPQLGMYL